MKTCLPKMLAKFRLGTAVEIKGFMEVSISVYKNIRIGQKLDGLAA